MTEVTVSQEKRRNGGKTERQPFDRRRAKHADAVMEERANASHGGAVRLARICAFFHHGSRLRRPIERPPNLVIFVTFVVKPSFVFVPPLPL